MARSFASARVPVTKELVGLIETDGKRPDGVTLVPWQSGKSLCWDVTVTCPLAESYLSRATPEAGAAAEMAASHKEEKYVDLGARYFFEPIAVETLGVFTASACHLLDDLGRRISLNSGEAERPATCTRGSRYWCSASMLSYYMTVCQPLTALIDDRTHFLIFTQFLNSLGIIFTEGLQNNNNNNNINNNNIPKCFLTIISMVLENVYSSFCTTIKTNNN